VALTLSTVSYYMSELGYVINITKFQGLWITLLKLWKTPQYIGGVSVCEKGRRGGKERI